MAQVFVLLVFLNVFKHLILTLYNALFISLALAALSLHKLM